MSKECTKCGEMKPLEKFHKNRASKDGHTVVCKTCRKEQNRMYSEMRKDTPPPPNLLQSYRDKILAVVREGGKISRSHLHAKVYQGHFRDRDIFWKAYNQLIEEGLIKEWVVKKSKGSRGRQTKRMISCVEDVMGTWMT